MQLPKKTPFNIYLYVCIYYILNKDERRMTIMIEIYENNKYTI